MSEALHPDAHGAALAEELCIPQAAALREQLLQQLAEAGGRDLVLELSAVAAIDSAGVQLLLALRRSLQAGGAQLRLAAPSAPVREVLLTYGLQALLDTTPAT